jgi:hypothetical protein
LPSSPTATVEALVVVTVRVPVAVIEPAAPLDAASLA